MHQYLYIFGSIIIVSLISVIAILPYLFKKQASHRTLITILSLSVGTMLGSVFIHFIPEAIEHGYNLSIAVIILIGFLSFFILERLIHWHHNKCDHEPTHHGEGHSHAYHLAPLNILGDGVHNLLDGMVIAGAYLVNIPLGVAATVSILFHEIPQEIADFGVLLYSGMKKSRAVFFNLLSALASVVGGLIAILLSSKVHGFQEFIIPFAAGSFLYIAASNLVPELHRHCKMIDTFLHLLAIMVGIGIMIGLTFLEVAH